MTTSGMMSSQTVAMLLSYGYISMSQQNRNSHVPAFRRSLYSINRHWLL